MPPSAWFGIESGGLNLAVHLLLLCVVVLYLALIYWTYADAKRRIEDPMLVGCATAAAVFPFVGAIVYMVLRPPEYLEDVRERELETQAAEARVRESQERQCPHCDYPIDRDFVRCPSCLRKLKERCSGCSRPLDRAWKICPYCETEVPQPTSARRTARRRGASGADSRAEVARTDVRSAEHSRGDGARAGTDLARAEMRPAAPPLSASEPPRSPSPARARRPSRPPAPES